MNILLLGSGGREDALAWRLKQSPIVRAAGGGARQSRASPAGPNASPIDPCDTAAVVELAKRRIAADLVVIGPEAPLVAGVADALREAGIPAFGPGAAAAQLEGSKGFTRTLRAGGYPTADYVRVETVAEALAALGSVLDPSGRQGRRPGRRKRRHRRHEPGGSGSSHPRCGRRANGHRGILEGEEASLFALVHGDQVAPLASAQDHKRVGEGDTGPIPAAWAPIRRRRS